MSRNATNKNVTMNGQNEEKRMKANQSEARNINGVKKARAMSSLMSSTNVNTDQYIKSSDFFNRA